MRFGICYNIDYHEEAHGSPSRYFGMILEQVDLLERLGYDTVWFSEHHCGGYSFGNPAVIAAAVAQRTKRIRIGTGVSLVPLHEPIFLAEQYGMLDVLSDGRLEYGIGRGYLMHEYGWLKIPVAHSHGRYHEAMDFIQRAWASGGRPMDFHGQHFQVDGYTYFPAPVQQPVPIYASAASTEESYRWAGRNGFNLGTALFLPDISNMGERIAAYKDALRESGFDPATREVMTITQMYCAPDLDEALRDGKTYAENYYRFFSKLAGTEGNPIQQYYSKVDALDLNRKGQLLLGDPETLTTRITDLRDRLGIDFVLMEVAQGSAPHDKICQALETFGTKVMPRFQTHAKVAAE